MSINVIISTSRSRGSRVDHLSAERLIMVLRSKVDPYVDTTYPIVANKRRELGTE